MHEQGSKARRNECRAKKKHTKQGVWPITDFRAICRAAMFDAKLVENGNIDEEHQDLQLCDVETFDSVMTSFQNGLGFCFTWQSADGSIACKGGVPMRVEPYRPLPYSWDETRTTAKKRAHPTDSLKVFVGSVAESKMRSERDLWKHPKGWRGPCLTSVPLGFATPRESHP